MSTSSAPLGRLQRRKVHAVNSADIELVRQPIPNMDKIYAVLDQIEADPEHWDQTNWSLVTECGTTMCFAGWACKMEGLTLGIEVKPGSYTASVSLADGRDISDAAELILGLTWQEARSLFVETIYGDDESTLRNDRQDHREQMFLNVKVEVQKISARAKEQQAAFERVAKELIASVPELEAVIQPNYLCPESRDTVLAHLGGQDGGS